MVTIIVKGPIGSLKTTLITTAVIPWIAGLGRKWVHTQTFERNLLPKPPKGIDYHIIEVQTE